MQSQLDLFKKTVRHEPQGDFLFYAHFTPDLDKRLKERVQADQETENQKTPSQGITGRDDETKSLSIEERFGMYLPVPTDPETTETEKPDFSPYFTDVEKPAGSFINTVGVLEIPAKFYHFTGYVSPLRNAKSFSDIERFPFPSAAGLDGSAMPAKVRAAHASGKVAVTTVGHMYETSWQIRGYEEFLQDMLDRPEWPEYILDRITERNVAVATAGAKAGVDFILTGDDVANQNSLMFSPAMWRKFLKSRWAKVYAAAKAIKPDIQIWYHSDGNVEAVIPELIEIGVTILNPLQPECMDLLKLKKEYGRHLVFDGTIGTQSTMPFGTPRDVELTVSERKKTLGYDGGLILSPTHVLEPEVPIANIEAFVRACKSRD